jgi:hypothetical protein
MELTRRHALAGAAALAASPLLSNAPAEAAAPLADKQAPSFYRYKVGDIQVTVVSDGKNVFPLTDSFITNAKKEDVGAALEKAFLPKDMFTIYFAPLVINTGGKLVVLEPATAPRRAWPAREPTAFSARTWSPPVSTPRQSIPW